MVDTLLSVLCWIEVDLDAVADNVRALQAAAQPRHGVTAVVKAQAYSNGIVGDWFGADEGDQIVNKHAGTPCDTECPLID